MARRTLKQRYERNLGWIGLAVLIGSCLGCGRTGGAPDSSGPRPNLLFISIDTLRADALSCYGNEHKTSPNIDALAEGGVLFEQATSTTSWTLPAHISMLTGLNISAHGICDERLWDAVGQRGGPKQLPLRGEYMSEPMARSGYQTAGFYTWRYLDDDYGFGKGFDQWSRVGNTVNSDAALASRYQALVEADDQRALAAWRLSNPEHFNYQTPSSREVVEAGIDWLDGRTEETDPFFLFLHLFDVHDDYLAPEPFASAFDSDYAGPITGSEISSPNSIVQPGLAPRDLENLVSRYLGEVAWVDSQIGRLMQSLEQRGLLENTLVVLTSDHGEEFFEHGNKTHRTQLFPESVHVPLIFSWPGHLDAGRRIESPVGIIDIAPTTAALLDVPAPASVSGRDLSEALRDGTEPEDFTYLTELQLFQSGNPIPIRHTGLRRGDELWLRVVQRNGDEAGALLDLRANPKGLGPGQPLGAPGLVRFHELLDPVRVHATEQRERAPSRASLFKHMTGGDDNELAGMGYLDSGAPVEVTSKLCLDGCFAAPPPDSD